MITLRTLRPTDHRWLWTLVSAAVRSMLLLVAATVWTAIGIRALWRRAL
ncbi:hypothetical protein ACTD5D_40460 [Nocardia takedensis]